MGTLFKIVLIALLACAGAGLALHWYFRDNPVSPVASVEPPDSPDGVLDREQREYIWQIEHEVLVLSKNWFKHMANALSANDAPALKTMLSQDFQGQLMNQPAQEEMKTSFAQVTRLKDSGSSPRSESRDAFVDHLLAFRRLFVRPPKVKVFAKTLNPLDRKNFDGAWQGMGVARMWGEVGPGKPGEVVLAFNFTMPRPERNQNPGWLTSMRITKSQVSRAEKFLLKDATRERGIDPDRFHDNWKHADKLSNTGGVYLCDYNRDGILDLLVVDVRQCIVLYQGLENGRFKDVTSEMLLPAAPPPDAFPHFAVFADLDGDGWEDLILLGKVYRNVEGRYFSEQTHLCNLRIPIDATGAVVADYNRDGKIDLYLTRPGRTKVHSWLDGKGGQDSGNQLWKNLGNWRFEEVSAATKTDGDFRSVFSAVWLDVNDDGWPDLYVPNEFGHGALLVNNGKGEFTKHVIGKLPGDFGTMGITCGDVNNDGKIDIYLANMYSKTGSRIIGNLKKGTYSDEITAQIQRFVTGSQLYLNQGGLKFAPMSQEWQMNDVGWAYGPALLDLDNDGFLDLFATSGFMSRDEAEPDG